MQILTIKQLALVTKFLSDRDNLSMLGIYLPDKERYLFLIQEPTPEQIQQSERFSAEEIYSLRRRLYPPVEVTERPKPKIRTIDEIRDSAPIIKTSTTPKYKLTQLQQEKLQRLGVDLSKAEIAEQYVGGNRPQHQQMIILTEKTKYVISRRGKLLKIEER